MRLTAGWPGSGGHLRADFDDFIVEEQIPYEPSGEGGHLFLWVEKRGLDTLEAARALAEDLGVATPGRPLPPEVGIAGLKDRHAIARQWMSLPWPAHHEIPKPRRVEVGEGRALEVRAARRHPHKLRRGHVAENRFAIRISGVPPGGFDRARAILARLSSTGVPNPYGPQRFGVDGANAARAQAILRGQARPPKERRLLTLLFSALQAEVFNHLLRDRMAAELLGTALLGDRMVKHATGGQFIVEDPGVEQPRVDALEISPTGPLPGKKTPPAAGQVRAQEAAVLEALGLDEALARRLGPGGRRPLRYPLDPEARVEVASDTDAGAPDVLGAYWLHVALPSGAYATALLDEIVKPEDGPFRRSTPSGEAA